jgi:hypothetical protein
MAVLGSLGRDGPDPMVAIEFGPEHAADLAAALPGQEHQPECAAVGEAGRDDAIGWRQLPVGAPEQLDLGVRQGADAAVFLGRRLGAGDGRHGDVLALLAPAEKTCSGGAAMRWRRQGRGHGADE